MITHTTLGIVAETPPKTNDRICRGCLECKTASSFYKKAYGYTPLCRICFAKERILKIRRSIPIKLRGIIPRSIGEDISAFIEAKDEGRAVKMPWN